MPKSPIDTLLDGVEWRPKEPAVTENLDLPYTTHEGVFEFAGQKLRCYRLSNGQAVFNAVDFERLFAEIFR